MLQRLRRIPNQVSRIARRARAAMGDAAVRERAAACATFALIFVFAAGSMDFLISGGPDWNPGAAGAPRIVRAEMVTTTSLHEDAVWVPPPAPPSPEMPEFVDNGPVGELLGGPDMIFASSDYFDSAPFNRPGDALGPGTISKPMQTSFSTAAPAPAGKEKSPTTVS